MKLQKILRNYNKSYINEIKLRIEERKDEIRRAEGPVNGERIIDATTASVTGLAETGRNASSELCFPLRAAAVEVMPAPAVGDARTKLKHASGLPFKRQMDVLHQTAVNPAP